MRWCQRVVGKHQLRRGQQVQRNGEKGLKVLHGEIEVTCLCASVFLKMSLLCTFPVCGVAATSYPRLLTICIHCFPDFHMFLQALK